MKILVVENRQRTRKIDLTALRKLTRCLLEEMLATDSYELGIHLVAAEEMAIVNETFLQHGGSTDVITFDHHETMEKAFEFDALPGNRCYWPSVHGEVFISIDDAVKQAREFKTTWQAELARYIAHALLHLKGYDDLKPVQRKRMKREEDRMVREIAGRFSLSKLERRTKKLA